MSKKELKLVAVCCICHRAIEGEIIELNHNPSEFPLGFAHPKCVGLEKAVEVMLSSLSPDQIDAMRDASKFLHSQRAYFMTDVKLVLRKHFVRGNKAMPDDGGTGCASDYGFLDEDDMATGLVEAAQGVMRNPLDFLYEHAPRPRVMTRKEVREWLEVLTEE